MTFAIKSKPPQSQDEMWQVRWLGTRSHPLGAPESYFLCREVEQVYSLACKSPGCMRAWGPRELPEPGTWLQSVATLL